MRCGRQPSGKRFSKSGVCKASIDFESNGINEGRNAGRICWAVSGTLCSDNVCQPESGSLSKQGKISCISCLFFNKVKKEEGYGHFTTLKKETVKKLKSIIIKEIEDN
jgi:hypothetical protein